MNFGQMYTLFNSLFDKALSPYIPPQQFDDLANTEYSNWIETEYKKLEANQKYDEQLAYLFETFSKANSNTIDFVTDLTSSLRYRIRFSSTYTDCNNKTQPANIQPAGNDEIDTMIGDSFWNPTDVAPVTIVTELPSGNPGFQVYSTNTPLSLNLTYIRQPQVIDSTNNPNTNFEMPDQFARWVVEKAVTRADVLVENFERAKAEQTVDSEAEE